MVLAASDLPAPLFPMHQREALARGEGSRTDTMHIIVTSVNSLSFRLYSIGTVLILLVTGGLTATQASRLEANLPTPWAGVSERISIRGYLLWQATLAMMLMGAEPEGQ
jgi:hypothetical protein